MLLGFVRRGRGTIWSDFVLLGENAPCMKYLLPALLFILLTSCDPAEPVSPPPPKPYVFEAWITNDTLFVSFQNSAYWHKGWYIEIADSPEFNNNGKHGFKNTELSSTNPTVAFVPFWHPTWVRLETDHYLDTIKVD